METKLVTIENKELIFFRYKAEWVFPFVTTYKGGLGTPIAILLYSLEDNELEYYADITVNLPKHPRDAGCQFVDTNNNGEDLLDWLEEIKFGKRTGNNAQSGFCEYSEFDFYSGENFWVYKKLCSDSQLIIANKNALKKVITNIKQFEVILNDLFESIHETDSDELNELITENFPFDKSLDEVILDIKKWTDTITYKLD